jgi:hypothetical protein
VSAAFKFVSASDIVASKNAELDWVLHPLAVKGSAMMIYGRQGIGKSSLVTQLAHSCATGDAWMGFGVRATGKTLFLSLDMPEAEARRLLLRADEHGLDISQMQIISPEDEGEGVQFNILDEGDFNALHSYCQEMQPVMVIVDTIHDSYSMPMGQGVDINALLRTVITRFQRACAPAAIVYLNHMRKGNAFTDENDSDSFMGGQALEGKASASLQIVRNKEDQSLHLKIRKLRLDSYPSASVPLELMGGGFFRPKLDYRQMLATWPDFLDAEARAQAIEACRSKARVFQDIADLSGVAVDTVKKQYQRNKGVDYPWMKYLNEHERDKS